MSFKKLLTAVFLLATLQVQAQILELQFKDTNGDFVNKSSRELYINPTGEIQLALAAGLDRKLRFSVSNSDGEIVTSQTTRVIGASDRIVTEYGQSYGIHIQISKLIEGEYTFKTEVLDTNESVIQTNNYKYIIDRIKPVIPGLITRAGGYSVDVLTSDGHAETSSGELFINNLVDNFSGLNNAVFYTIDAHSVRREISAKIDTQIGQARALLNDIINIMPHNRQEYEIGFEIYDKAGNKAVISRMSSRDTTTPSFTLSVYNPNLTAWVPYTSGMEAYENPVQFRIERDKADHVNFNGTNYGWADGYTDYSKDKVYNYMTSGYPFGSTYTTYLTRANKHSSFRPAGYNIKLAPDVDPGPKGVSMSFHVKENSIKSNGSVLNAGWHRSTTFNVAAETHVDKVRITAEPRNYTQEIYMAGGKYKSCLVEPGETFCDLVNESWIINSGKSYSAFAVYLRHLTKQELSSHYTYLYQYWDFNKPVIEQYNFDNITNSLYMKIIDNDRVNSWQIGMWDTPTLNAYAINTKNNARTILPRDHFSELTYNIKEATFNINSLDDGIYDFEFEAIDTYQNKELKRLSIGKHIDNTSPKLGVLSTHSIKSLSEITITLTDAIDISPIIKNINLKGGPANENVNLSWRSINSGVYKLEYPVMFPSMTAGEIYTLTVDASDVSGNVATEVITFSYNPPLIDLNEGGRTIAVPALGKSVLNAENKPAIYTTPILIDGVPIQGHYEILATLRSDAGSAAVVNGLTIIPGQTIMLPAYDFSSSGGRMQLSVHAVDTTQSVSLPFLFQSTAPSAPTVMAKVDSFVPDIKFSIPMANVIQAIEPLKVSLTVSSDNKCSIISTGESRQAYSFTDDRRCYLESTNATFSNEALIRTGNVLSTQTYINSPKTMTIGYEVVIYSGAKKERIVLSKYSQDVIVRPAAGAISHTLSSNKSELLHQVAQSSISLIPTTNLRCSRITTIESEAIALAQKGSGDLTCHIQWPLNIDLLSKDNNETVSGVMQTLGDQPLNWSLSVFTTEGQRIVIENKSEILTVIKPQVPEILGYEVTFKDAGLKLITDIVIYHNLQDEIINIKAFVTPQAYVQQVSLLNRYCSVPVGDESCNIAMRYFPSIEGPLGTQINTGIVDTDKKYFKEVSTLNLKIDLDARSAEFKQLIFGRDVDNAVVINGKAFSLGDDEFFVVMQTPHSHIIDKWWHISQTNAQFELSADFEHVPYIVDGDRYVYFNIPGLARSDGMILTSKEQEIVGDALLLKYDASKLTDGLYHVKVTAQDAYGNGDTHTFNDVLFNRNAPQIKVELLGQNFNQKSQVSFFDDIRVFTHSGWEDGAHIVSVTVDGQPMELTGEEHKIKGIKNRPFTPNSTLNMVVVAQNTSGNMRTETYEINYLPVEFSSVKTHDVLHQSVETMRISISQSKGMKCKAATSAELAVAQSRGAFKGCTLEWVSLPDGLEVRSLPYRFIVEGGINNNPGVIPLEFNVYLHNYTGEKVLAYRGREQIIVKPAPAPLLTLSNLNKLQDGVYGVPINARNVTNYEIITVPADVLMTVSKLDQSVSQDYKYKQRVRSDSYSLRNSLKRLFEETNKAWSSTEYNVKVVHSRTPDKVVNESFKVITLPDAGVRARLSLESKDATNMDTIVGHVELGRFSRGEIIYDMSRMGKWEAYLSYRKDGEYVRVSETVELNSSGKAQLEADAGLIYQQDRKLYAVIKTKGPYPDYQRTVISSGAQIVVIQAAAIAGEATARKLEGVIPFSASMRFEFATAEDRAASKPVTWEYSDNQAVWEQLVTNPGMRIYSARVSEPGTGYYRVRMENKLTGEKSYSEVMRVIGFDAPKIRIDGPDTIYKGQTTKLRVYTRQDLDMPSEGVTEWSTDDGQSWEEADAEHEVELNQTTVVQARYRLNSTSTLVGDQGYVTASYRVNVVEPLPVRLRFNGKTNAELGTVLNLTGTATHGNSRVNSALVMQWVTPTGKVISDSQLNHVISEADIEEGDIGAFRFQAWVNGLKESTFNEQIVDITLWQYSIPEVKLSLLSRVQIAPATIVARVTVPYFFAPGVEIEYEWLLPEGVEVSRNSSSVTYLTANKSGVQNIGLRVTDNRGNVQELYEFIDVVDADPMQVGIEQRPSNSFMRAPLAIAFNTNARPGHPNDRVADYQWLLNGEVLTEETKSRATLSFEEPGNYEVGVQFTSRYGQIETLTENVIVVPNQPPFCAPYISETSSSVTINSNCSDEDGKIISIRYQWREDGYESSGGTRLRFTKNLYEHLNVTIRAVDDSGAQTTSEIRWVR